MSSLCLSAASYIDSTCLGNRSSGLRAWSRDVCPEKGFSWASVSASEFPRFDRMNGLCRLTVAAIELLGVDFSAWPEERRLRTGVCFGSALGSLATDLEYLSGLAEPAGPSPTLFAYTLASAAVGEICIRHRLQGPNISLFCDPNDSRPVLETAMTWLESGSADACLCVVADTPPSAAFGSYPALAAIPFCAAACLLEFDRPDAPRAVMPDGSNSFSAWIRQGCHS